MMRARPHKINIKSSDARNSCRGGAGATPDLHSTEVASGSRPVVGAQSVALCSLAAEARERCVTMYRKVCSECDTDLRYSCVIAHPAVVLLHIDNPTRRPVASIELARALREELGVPTRFVVLGGRVLRRHAQG